MISLAKHSCCLLTVALALSAADTPPAIRQARDLYMKGVDGDRDATHQSTRILELLAEQHPDDPLIAAYLGSNRLLESGRTLALWKKNRLAKEGLEALDRAVRTAPENVEIRFVRAISTYHLPGFFRREEQCEADFNVLVPKVRRAVESGALDRTLGAAAFYYYGLLKEKKGDRAGAVEAWRSAASVFPNTRGAAEAASKLKNSGS